MCAKNSGEGVPSGLLKMFLRVLMSTTLWWMCMALPGSLACGLAMKVAYILWRSAASRAVRLNRKTWSARSSGCAVDQVDLHLRRAVLVDEGVDLDVLVLAELVDVIEQRVEFVDRGDAVGLAARLGAPGAAHRRLQRIVRVAVLLDQVELQLRRHDRLPAALRVQLQRCCAARGAAPSRRAARPNRSSRGSPARWARRPRARAAPSWDRPSARCRFPPGSWQCRCSSG